MESLSNLLQIILDTGLLFACCESIFREKLTENRRDFLLLPVILIFFMASRINVVAGSEAAMLFHSGGYEIAPADDLSALLFLMLSVLLANSLIYKPADNGYTLSGTLAAFSLYLMTRMVSIAILSLFGASGSLLLFASRLLSLLILVSLSWFSLFAGLRRTLRNGGFFARLAVVNAVVVLLAVLVSFSFDAARLMDSLWMVMTAFAVLFLVDGGLLFYNQQKVQEQKRIHMIKQYVPIVEELISQVRARQHQFNNRIFAIDAAVNGAETLEEARKNVAALTQSLTLPANDQELLSCDSKIIAGMLYGKIRQAEYSQIDVKVELHGLFKKCTTPETEWAEVIGILLDNALEASASGDTVYLKVRQNGGFLELTVSNPAAPLSNTEFMRLFHRGVTSKKDKAAHGFGLYNLLQLTERCHGKILTRNEPISGRNYVVFGVLLP